MGDIVKFQRPMDPALEEMVAHLRKNVGKDVAIGLFGYENLDDMTPMTVVEVGEKDITLKINLEDLESLYGGDLEIVR